MGLHMLCSLTDQRNQFNFEIVCTLQTLLSNHQNIDQAAGTKT